MAPKVIAEIVVEQLVANSDHYRISDLCVGDRSLTATGDIVAMIETSKTVFEIVSPTGGRLFFAPGIRVAGVIRARQLLAVVATPDSTEADISHKWQMESPPPGDLEVAVRGATFSKAARRRLEELGVPPDVFAERGLVTAADVENYFARNPR